MLEFVLPVALAAVTGLSVLTSRMYNRIHELDKRCLLYTSPSPRDYAASRMPSSA